MQSGTFQGNFEIISKHGRLLQANGGQIFARTEVDKRSPEEIWEIYIFCNKVALRNHKTKRWLCGESDGKVAMREFCDEWELWTVTKVHESKFAFESFHGFWLCASPPEEDNSGGEVSADKTHLQGWETFNVIQIPPGSL
jgi:hypothetical protein